MPSTSDPAGGKNTSTERTTAYFHQKSHHGIPEDPAGLALELLYSWESYLDESLVTELGSLQFPHLLLVILLFLYYRFYVIILLPLNPVKRQLG